MSQPSLEQVLASASSAAGPLADTSPAQRAEALDRLADDLDAAVEQLVPVALAETALPEARLRSEVGRTTGQLRLFADVLRDGTWLGLVREEAVPDGAVPRPQLVRVRVPMGPVVVFAGGNFPFAFSVAGGDTASALAAGCPVIVKTHPGHPRTSALTAEIVRDSLRASGLPDGAFGVIAGESDGARAVQDARVKAGAFTGSLRGGRFLYDLACSRPEPMPFFAEMGSSNPVFILPGASSVRGSTIAADFISSFTLGSGQFCTKPGLLFVPRDSGIDVELRSGVAACGSTRMLSEPIRTAHAQKREALSTVPGVRSLGAGETADPPDSVTPELMTVTFADFVERQDELSQECFGPTSLVITYESVDNLVTFAAGMEGSLTATIHAEETETASARPLVRALRDRVGRLVWNGWPTGVTVGWAMHHGGPYPASTFDQHTSVGATAIDRFLRPVCFQDLPDELLPPEAHGAPPAGSIH